MAVHVESLRVELQTKISALLAELSAGKISHDQFELAYGRYHNRLMHTEDFLTTACDSHPFQTGELIRELQAQPLGVSFYHHASGTTVERVGQFDVPLTVMTPVLNDFSLAVEWQVYTEPAVRLLKEGLRVVFMARRYTTAMVLFSNEPSRQQLRDMERMHHDFEETNKRLLSRSRINPYQVTPTRRGFIKAGRGITATLSPRLAARLAQG